MTNPETHLISHNRVIHYIGFIFVDRKNVQIYTFPKSPDGDDGIRFVIGFNYVRLFRPNKHLERYYITKPKDERLLFKIADKKYMYVGHNVDSFSTDGNITKFGLKYGFNDVKFAFAYDKTNIYYMTENRYEPIEQYKKSTYKDEYEYLYRNGKINGKKLRNYKQTHTTYHE